MQTNEKNLKENKSGLKEFILDLVQNNKIKELDFVMAKDIEKVKDDSNQDNYFIKKISAYYVLKEIKGKMLFNFATIIMMIIGLGVSIINIRIGSVFLCISIAFLTYSILKANQYVKYLMDKYFN